MLAGLLGAAVGLRAGRRLGRRGQDAAGRLVGRRAVLLQGAGTAMLVAGCSAADGRRGADAAPTTSPARLLGPDDFAPSVEADNRFLLNVHTPDEGSIPGTDAAVPFDELRAGAGELPAGRDAPLAVCRRTGAMSAAAMETLGDLGYGDLVELQGGMVAWERAGRQVLPPDRPRTAGSSVEGGSA